MNFPYFTKPNINNLPIDPYFEPGQLSPHLHPPPARPPDHALVSKFSPFSRLPTRIMFAFLFSRKSCPSVPPNFHRPNNDWRTVRPHYTVTSWFLLLPPFRSDILLGKSILTTVGHWSSLSVPDRSNILCSYNTYVHWQWHVSAIRRLPQVQTSVTHFKKEICVRKKVINL